MVNFTLKLYLYETKQKYRDIFEMSDHPREMTERDDSTYEGILSF